jgi:plasmid stabilization system protein ParE
MNFRVHQTPQAEADIERLYGSIAKRRGFDVADQWYEVYTKALERVRTMPLSCGIAYENPRFSEEVRCLLFWIHRKRKFRALFVVRDDEVVILTVRAPGERDVSSDDILN